jgi:hypothetical protein
MESDEREVFVDGVILLMHPYLEATILELYRGKQAVGVMKHAERIHRALLGKFWTLAQSDTKISMFMIPIMTYLRRAVRQKQQQTAPKALPLNN